MSWNFRVAKKGDYLAIYYAHYDEAGNLVSTSENQVSPDGEDVEDLRQTLQLMLDACEDPVVDYESLETLEP